MASQPLFILLTISIGSIGPIYSEAFAQQRTHRLKAAPDTVVWGYYDGSVPPVLTVDSGDIVDVEAMITGARLLRTLGVPEDAIRPDMEEMDEKVKQEGPHLLLGPVAVRGAEAGDVLEVRILEMGIVDPWAVNLFAPGGGALPKLFPYQGGKFVRLDLERNVALFGPGIEIPLRPFFGSLGVAPPPISGRIGSGPPGVHTGNLDNKELTAGSTLYIPVHVKDAFLFIGDGHAAQGDGEVNGTALEASLSGKLQLVVRKDLKFSWPRAETPQYYMTMGLDPDLDTAAEMAVSQMVDHLVQDRGMSREDAYVLCSAAVDLRVTQVVDGTKGIHALLPKNLFVGGGR
ncbi:MAG TPA: acetamidase/formamidase family protein [Vicinamibacteria bacterium]|nr:acetamidase/formamidase family protein [Vicinamibacteria bacterium]